MVNIMYVNCLIGGRPTITGNGFGLGEGGDFHHPTLAGWFQRH